MCYAQIVFYNVYVPLLLGLLNAPTFTVCADFNGNASMFGSNAAKQCVAMPIHAILYSKLNKVYKHLLNIRQL